MCEMYKLFDFSEFDLTSYFYAQLVDYYEHQVDKKFLPLQLFLNFKKLSVLFSKMNIMIIASENLWDENKDVCLVDEKDVIYNATKGVLRNVVIEGTKTNVKNIELYKYTRGNKSK